MQEGKNIISAVLIKCIDGQNLRFSKFLSTFLIIFSCFFTSFGQDDPINSNRQGTGETDSTSYITMKAVEAYHSSVNDRNLDTLLGDVEMIQDSLIMYCDRAYVADQIYAKAYDNVVIIHEDSLWIFADSLHYDGKKKMAELFGQVILQEGEKKLYTHELTYDISNKIAFYTTGGTVIEGNSTIVSQEGYYYSNLQESRLMGNVEFRDSSQVMNTDSIIYYSSSQRLKFIAPTTITQDSTQIYCENGIYGLEENEGVLSQNIQVLTGDSTLITSSILQIDQDKGLYTFLINPNIDQKKSSADADTIIYNSNTGDVFLNGNAQYNSDTESITAPQIEYNVKTEKYRTIGRASITKPDQSIDANNVESDSLDNTLLLGAVRLEDHEEGIIIQSEAVIQHTDITKVYSPFDQPMMTYLLGEDSLLLRADTFEMTELYPETDSVLQIYDANQKVKLQKGDVFGRAENLVYNKQDSLITLTGRAILWSDSTQLTGDTIHIFMGEEDIKYIDLIGNAFILSPDEKNNLNQIKGLKIRNYFSEGTLIKTHVLKNAELLYLIFQDQKYEAINVARSSQMLMIFNDGEIEHVKMDGDHESNLHEYKPEMIISEFYLDGYEWRIEELPLPNEFVYDYNTLRKNKSAK